MPFAAGLPRASAGTSKDRGAHHGCSGKSACRIASVRVGGCRAEGKSWATNRQILSSLAQKDKFRRSLFEPIYRLFPGVGDPHYLDVRFNGPNKINHLFAVSIFLNQHHTSRRNVKLGTKFSERFRNGNHGRPPASSWTSNIRFLDPTCHYELTRAQEACYECHYECHIDNWIKVIFSMDH